MRPQTLLADGNRFAVHAHGHRGNWFWTPGMAFSLVRIADATVLFAVTFACFYVQNPRAVASSDDVYALILTIILVLYFLNALGLYRSRQATRPGHATIRTLLAAVAATSLAYAPQFETAIVHVDTNYAALAAPVLALTAWRAFLAILLSWHETQCRWRQRIAIIGAGEHGRRLLADLTRSGTECDVVGIFDERRDRLPPQIEGIPVSGGIDELINFARGTRLDRIIVALPSGAEKRLSAWLKRLSVLPVELDYCPDTIAHDPIGRQAWLGSRPLVKMANKPLDGWSGLQKLLEDRILAVFFLFLSLPLMSFIALGIRFTSCGPIIFRQRRFGFNNNIIEVLKFRTMYQNADRQNQAIRSDPRVTPFGRFLRRTSLDELPQLWNVVRGDMSLVGPRPHAVAHNEQYARLIDAYLGRHRVKPGITGWAQVNGLRGETETLDKMDARVRHDLFYIENWSLLFDLRILARTLVVGFKHPNAY